jgi:glycosyltransferase involved in cell wall biosynthesis
LKLAIVSPYPPPGCKHIYGSGVASYTKNLVYGLKNLDTGMEIHVLADRNPSLQEKYVDSGVVVHRVFDRGIWYFIKIFRALREIKPDVVHIQHEYFLYGGAFSATFFPLLVLLSRVVSHRVVVTFHGVIPLNLLEDPKFRGENGIEGPSWLLKIGIWVMTKLICLLAHVIIVHEHFLEKSLVEDYGVDRGKIRVIPHGVEDVEPIPQEEAKKKLGLRGRKVILFFGYLTGYKGLELLIEAYRYVVNQMDGTILIIAGGEHPRLKQKTWYQRWLKQLTKRAEKINQEVKRRGEILFTGYIPEEAIPIYYSAADLITLLYTARISASGPEALAIAFKKPIVLANPECSNSLYNPKILAEKILSILNEPNLSHKLVQQNQQLVKERSWDKIAQLSLKVYIGAKF